MFEYTEVYVSPPNVRFFLASDYIAEEEVVAVNGPARQSPSQGIIRHLLPG